MSMKSIVSFSFHSFVLAFWLSHSCVYEVSAFTDGLTMLRKNFDSKTSIDKTMSISRLYHTKESNEEWHVNSRRDFMLSSPARFFLSGSLFSQLALKNADAANYPPIDVNNAMAREFTAFPG